MSERNDGGPAFSQHADTGNLEEWRLGMSLRDYFAAKAMQAEIITTFSDATPRSAEAFFLAAAEAGRTAEDHAAMNAYRLADAMLRAREAK